MAVLKKEFKDIGLTISKFDKKGKQNKDRISMGTFFFIMSLIFALGALYGYTLFPDEGIPQFSLQLLVSIEAIISLLLLLLALTSKRKP